MNNFQLTNEQVTKLAELAKAHNDSIDHFINVTLKEHFGTDKLNVTQWFEAQDLISRQCFYKKGHAVQEVIRAFGIDCKMDMQSNKLHCPEIDVFAY